MFTPKQVASFLKQEILQSYDSMHDFSDEIGVSPSNLSNMISGKNYLSPKKALIVANTLGLNPRFLAFGEQPPILENYQDSVKYRYILKPKILMELNPTSEEQELIDLIPEEMNRSIIPSRVRISFFNSEKTYFDKIIHAAKSLAGKLIDSTLLQPQKYKELLCEDHGDHIRIYRSYLPFIYDITVTNNYTYTSGYVEFSIQLDFYEIESLNLK